MKVVKYVLLELLWLGAKLVCGILTIKILETLWNLGYENIYINGCKVGFLAWILLSIMKVISDKKKCHGSFSKGYTKVDPRIRLYMQKDTDGEPPVSFLYHFFRFNIFIEFFWF